jgi:hypothetical protein
MRFLLHPTTHRAATHGVRNRTKDKVASPSSWESSRPTPQTSPVSDARESTYIQSWGQQCSPSCGCVVRFEATVDPVSKMFTSACYHAKSVLVTANSVNGPDATPKRLQPARTIRNNRPMFRPCSCDSLHQLASRVTNYLPNKNTLTFGSSMEFAGLRSSPAFRHTVLEKQGLPTTDTHCFDVVEEALTAMVKGHMPKSRKQVPYKQALASGFASSSHTLTETERGNAIMTEEDQFRIDMSAFLMTPPRAMSALRMMDVNARYSPFGFADRDFSEDNTTSTTGSGRFGRKKESQVKPKSYDWVSYVDELYEQEIQKSA